MGALCAQLFETGEVNFGFVRGDIQFRLGSVQTDKP